MSWKATSFGFAFWIALASLGHADTIVSLAPSQENTLIESSAGTLSNAEGNLYVGLTNQASGINIRRGLIEFNIAGDIPAGATITGGTLTMTDVTTGNTGARTLSLYDMLQAWGQGSSYSSGGQGTAATNGDATWLYTFYDAANPSSSPAWADQDQGGDFSATLSASALDSTNGQLVIWSSSSNPQVKTDIQNWLDDSTTNYGWLLQGVESGSQTAKVLGAGPYYAGSQPTLTVSYAVPEPSTLCLAISGLLAIGVVKARRCGRRKT
jgi:hypothetical protein